MNDDTEEQEFEILDALAQVQDIGDFRLTEFMRQHGMNPSQPVIFYRKLLKAARENESFVDSLLSEIARLEEAVSQLKARLSSQGDEIKNLKASVNQLQNQAHHKESERRELEAAASELQEMAVNYQLLMEFLKGRMHPKTVETLYHDFYELRMEQLHADIGRQPAPNPGRLEKIRQWLVGQLREVLRLPKDTLQEEKEELKKELQELQEQRDALADYIKRIYGMGGK